MRRSRKNSPPLSGGAAPSFTPVLSRLTTASGHLHDGTPSPLGMEVGGVHHRWWTRPGFFCEVWTRSGNWPGLRGEHRIVRVRARVGNLRLKKLPPTTPVVQQFLEGLRSRRLSRTARAWTRAQATVVACGQSAVDKLPAT